MKKADLIRRELAKLSPVDFSDPDQAKILCPFHNDSNPSLDVVLQRRVKRGGKIIGVGTYSCWSCKAHGPWNKLADKLGLEKWTDERAEEYADQPDNAFWVLSRDLEQMQDADQEYVKPITDGPWEGGWRGLSGTFLRSMGAESLWDDYAGEYRLFLPIKDAFGKLVGHVAARGDDSDIPDKQKYLNSKRYEGTKYWFGLDTISPEEKAVVIVEGPFDMLRFRSEGIPAIANLGVQLREDTENTVSDEKIAQILSKGITNVVLALDADKAGRIGAPGFTQSFQKWGFAVYDLNMSKYLPNPEDPEAKMDPGDCPMEVINDLRSFIGSLK